MNKEKQIEINQFKKCPFCAEDIKQEAIVCKHCGKELDKNKVKKAQYKWSVVKKAIVILFIIGFINMIASVVSNDGSTKTSNNSGINVPVQKIPTWYGKKLVINSSEFNFMDYKEINVWPSYKNRVQVLGKLTQGDIIKIIGYDKNNDYCKIKKANLEGWIDCGWIEDLPYNMSNY